MNHGNLEQEYVGRSCSDQCAAPCDHADCIACAAIKVQLRAPAALVPYDPAPPAEEQVRFTANRLGELEAQRANEYARLTALQGMKNWDASQRVDVTFALPIRQAQAEYEIALEALRRLRCR